MERQQVALRWHWVYRDFLAAQAQCPSDERWLDTYARAYLRPHVRLLTAVHFSPKGFSTEEQVLARINQLGRRHFSPLVQAIQQPGAYEAALKNIARQLLTTLRHQPHPRDIYVIVGLDCTNIYSLVDHGRDVTVLCLESVQGQLEDVRLLLAHEVHHWARQVSFANLFASTLGERMVTEGLAAVFSEEACPGRAIWDYCFVPPATVEWVQHHWHDLEALLAWDQVRKNDLLDMLFARQPANSFSPGMPPRVGYVYGYLKVKAYLHTVNRLAGAA